MSARRRASAALAALGAGSLLSACALLALAAGELSISAAELTQRMAKRFPLERSVGGLLGATLSEPAVAMDEREQRLVADFSLTVKLTLTGKSLDGVLRVSGRPDYDAAARALFLREARVERLRFADMHDALAEALRKAAASLAKDALESKPLHVFKPEDFVRQGVTLEPTRLSVRADRLVLHLKR